MIVFAVEVVIDNLLADGAEIVAAPDATTPPVGFAWAPLKLHDHATSAVAIKRLGSAIRSFDFVTLTMTFSIPPLAHAVGAQT